MKRPKAGLIIIDLIILSGAYIFTAGLKPVMASYLSPKYLIGFGITMVLWVICSFYFKKYHISRREKATFLIRNVAYPNLIALAFVAFIIYAFNTTYFSRMMVFGTFGVATVLEMIFLSLYTYLLVSPEYDVASAFLDMPPTTRDKRKMKEAVIHSDLHVEAKYLREAIIEECGEKADAYIEDHVNLEDKRTLVISTLTRFNILRQPENHFETIVNLRRINDIQHLNRFFEAVNHKLPHEGRFIGCAETARQRLRRILRKYPPVINWIIYTLDYIVKRIFPKFYPTRWIYFFLTRGNNRVLTQAEILGRLYACGFEVTQENFVNGLYFFVTKRIKEPAFDINPTYGPFIKLKRVGKGGEYIKVYKLRTMYPYAEYLQDYVHKLNSLENGGKFKNDFRVARSRSFLRRLWIDELPMILNLFRGDLKLVGVRPLSQHYFDLYSKELQEKRTKYKPGLIPPFYADLPETLEEIQESEMRYLDSFEKRPFRTQWKYFWKALKNILFKKVRSA
ncbi:MAG: sugar transferase [Bacteroidales bacterium]|nr:sugar transferase [Bacteroidales bacterium]